MSLEIAYTSIVSPLYSHFRWSNAAAANSNDMKLKSNN